MSQLTFPLQQNELKLAVVVSLHRQAMLDRLTAGLPLSAPIWAKGAVDTGSTMSGVAADIIRQLGLPSAGQASSGTGHGSVQGQLFRVSLSIPPAGGLPGAMLTRPDLLVMELIDPPPDVDVLIGLDILLHCRLLLDGPARQFTLDF